MTDVVGQMASFIGSARYENLPPEIVEIGRKLLVDTVGCALGGYASTSATIARSAAEAVMPSAGAPAATIWVGGSQTSPDLAAFANGAAIRALDYNDYFHAGNNGGHPSDYIAPIVAAAEAFGADGRTVLTATVVAYEIFGAWMDGFTKGGIVFDQVVAGVIAAAGATAYVRGLSGTKLENALRLSIVSNVALEAVRFGEVSMWKGCAAAYASRNGLFVTDLAARGLTGPSNAFEGRGGFFEEHGISFDLNIGGPPYAIERAVFKRYPIGSLSQSAATAAVELRSLIDDLDAVELIKVLTNHEAVRVMAGDPEKWAPKTRELADHSLPYVVAVTFVKGAPTVAVLGARSHEDPAVKSLMQRVSVAEDPECQARYPEATVARITAVLKDGRRLQKDVSYHQGHFKNPMSREAVEGKFRDLALPVLSELRTAALLGELWGVDKASDMSTLIAAMRASETAP